MNTAKPSATIHPLHPPQHRPGLLLSGNPALAGQLARDGMPTRPFTDAKAAYHALATQPGNYFMAALDLDTFGPLPDVRAWLQHVRSHPALATFPLLLIWDTTARELSMPLVREFKTAARFPLTKGPERQKVQLSGVTNLVVYLPPPG